MKDKSSRPEIETTVSKLDEYETILITGRTNLARLPFIEKTVKKGINLDD